jgi:hypothetical protein
MSWDEKNYYLLCQMKMQLSAVVRALDRIDESLRGKHKRPVIITWDGKLDAESVARLRQAINEATEGSDEPT